MIRTHARLFLFLSLTYIMATTNAPAQAQGSVTPPVLTYVVDNSFHLRPIIGIVGAASVGNPIDVGFSMTQAAVPPTHDYILAVTPVSRWPIMLRARNGAVTLQSGIFSGDRNGCETAVNDPSLSRGPSKPSCSGSPLLAAATIDSVALSPAGSAAALFSSSQGRIYTFTGMLQSGSAAGVVNVNGLGTVSTFGISDDGGSVAIGVSDGQAGAVFLSNAGKQPRLVVSMSHPASIAFLHNSHDAVVADDQANAIYMLASGQAFAIASSQDGIARPVGIAASNDNQHIFVGNAETGSVISIANGGTPTSPIYCNCTLTGLYSTTVDSVFRLTDFSGGPVLLFDAHGATPRMTFVPVTSSQF